MAISFNQLASSMVPVNPEEEEIPNGGTIVVDATKGVPNVDVDGADAPFMGNRNYLEEAQMSLEGAPERKGMFGVKGTLRDVMGLVGDAFLLQSGNNRIYAPRREQERQSDALGGFTNASDPEAQLAAVERLAQVNPQAAQKLYSDLQNNMLKSSQAQSLEDNRASLQQARKDKMLSGLQNYAARILRGASGNPSAIPAAFDIISNRANQAGFSLEDLGLSTDMSPEELGVYSTGDMQVYQQEQIPLRGRQLDINQQNADTRRQDSNNRPARQPRATTKHETFLEFLDVPEDRRTKEQQNFIDAYTGQNKGKGSSSSRSKRKKVPLRMDRFKPL